VIESRSSAALTRYLATQAFACRPEKGLLGGDSNCDQDGDEGSDEGGMNRVWQLSNQHSKMPTSKSNLHLQTGY
jgi:hypothetical protein